MFDLHSLLSSSRKSWTPNKMNTSSTVPTRIIYRTAESPSPYLLSPREACVLQDSFADQDGTIYIYEISVSHSNVEGSPEHEPVEILFLGYVARPVPGLPGVSLLSIISQVSLSPGPTIWGSCMQVLITLSPSFLTPHTFYRWTHVVPYHHG